MDVYVVTYDIRDDRRRRDVYQCLLGWGKHLQFSVFWCQLSAPQLARLKAGLDPLLQHDEDQVLFFCLGPHDGRGARATASLGRPFEPPEHKAVIA